MPFKSKTFLEIAGHHLGGAIPAELAQVGQDYDARTTPVQKARCLYDLMAVLEREVDADTRRAMMEACGRSCIGASTLAAARRLQKEASDLDDLLARLNQAHIGGGHLHRQGNAIHAAYERCYCGSVSQTRQAFLETYCHCSCGWYRQLFETLLERPVQVELLSSVIQGSDRCRFIIHLDAGAAVL